MTRIVIVGAGISGLATAWNIKQLAGQRAIPVELLLAEADSHIGGKVRSAHDDGFVMEWGPNGFLDGKPFTLELCRKLGLDGMLLPASDFARKRFVFSRDRLHPLPTNPLQFFASSLLSIRGRLRILAEPWAAPAPGDDETVAHFATRRLGREACAKLIDPMVSGVFAGDPERLSLVSAFPRIHELERDYGGLIKAMLTLMRERRKKQAAVPRPAGPAAGPAGPAGRLTSFAAGLQVLTDRCADTLSDVIRTQWRAVAVERLDISDTQEYRLTFDTPDGQVSERADIVILALPAYETATLLSGMAPTIASACQEIPYAKVAVIGLGFERRQIHHPLDGFGFVVPSGEQRQILGTLFSSSIFASRAPDGKVLLRTMVGGIRHPELVDLDAPSLIGLTVSELTRILGIDGPPVFTTVIHHQRAIPQYFPGHGKILERIRGELPQVPGLFLTGNAYNGIGMNDCTREAVTCAEDVFRFLGKH